MKTMTRTAVLAGAAAVLFCGGAAQATPYATTNGLPLVDLTTSTDGSHVSGGALKASGAGTFEVQFPAKLAFDHVLGQYNYVLTADSSTNIWLAYSFDEATVVNSLGMWSGTRKNEWKPDNFRFYGSNDYDGTNVTAATWTLLDTETGIPSWQNSELRVYSFDNTATYKAYKISFAVSGKYAKVDELEFYNIDTNYQFCTVTAVPAEYGAPTPAYGDRNILAGTVMDFSVPAVWTNETETLAALCKGFTVSERATAADTWSEVSNGTETAFSFTQPAGELKVEWKFDFHYKVNVSVGYGSGTVTGSGWYTNNETATLTAEATGTEPFAGWAGIAEDGLVAGNPYVLVVDKPYTNVQALFGSTQYVATNGSDAAHGFLLSAPKLTIGAAVGSLGATGTVFVAAGLYPITAQIDVTNAIRIIGQTGVPEDVVVTNTVANLRILRLNNADSAVMNLTLTQGQRRTGGLELQGGNLLIDHQGGMASNCVFRDGYVGGYYGGGAGFHAVGTNSLVTHCVVRGNACNTPGKTMLNASAALVGDSARFENSLVYDNTSSIGYAAVGVYGDGVVANCTVVGNSGDGMTGGIASRSSTYSSETVFNRNTYGHVTNCVVACNTNTANVVDDVTNAVLVTLDGPGEDFVRCATDGSTAFNDTCLLGTAATMFVNYAGGDYTPALNGVLCNKGILYEPHAATDLAGNPRVFDKMIDIGAYEVQRLHGFYISIQ